MAGFTTYLANKGESPSTYLEFRSWMLDLVNQLPQLETAKWVAGGTSSATFAAQWLPYACPDVAFVIEGSVLWYTEDGGLNWGAISQASTVSVGRIEFCFDTSLPSGYLWLDGSAQLVASYSALNTYLNTNISAANRRKAMFQTTWTSTSQATFTFVRPFSGLANGDTVDLYWNSGTNSRLGMTVSASSTTVMTLSGGTGDNIPNSGIPTIFTFNFSTLKFLLPDGRGVILTGDSSMGGGTDYGQGSNHSLPNVSFGYTGKDLATYQTQYAYEQLYCALIIKI